MLYTFLNERPMVCEGLFLLMMLMMISNTEKNKMFAVVQLQAHNYPDGIIRYINKLLKSRYE